MNRERRRLAEIEKHLAFDDPRLAEAFQLWHERCSSAEGSARVEPVDRLLVLAAWAVAALVLLAWLTP